MSSLCLSIIIPCYNEIDNVIPLTQALEKALAGLEWEVIFVDDNSPDGTIKRVRDIAQHNPRIRGIRRIGRRGLSSAVIEGAMSSSAPIIAVMDGDLQHDETCLKPMVTALQSGKYDLVVASRHIEGGRNDGLANGWRRALSQGGIWITQKLLSSSLTDPMSGCFAIRRSCFDERVEALSGNGFKILLDLVLARSTPLRIHEVPMIFRNRAHGESKLGLGVMVSFAIMVLKKVISKR